jgi:hypothetical protein
MKIANKTNPSFLTMGLFLNSLKAVTRLWTFLASPVPNTFSFFFEKREAVGEEPNLV